MGMGVRTGSSGSPDRGRTFNPLFNRGPSAVLCRSGVAQRLQPAMEIARPGAGEAAEAGIDLYLSGHTLEGGLRGLAQTKGKRPRAVEHLGSAEFERSNQGKGKRYRARVALGWSEKADCISNCGGAYFLVSLPSSSVRLHRLARSLLRPQVSCGA